LFDLGVRYAAGGPERRWRWYGETGVSHWQFFPYYTETTDESAERDERGGVRAFVGYGGQFYIRPAWSLDMSAAYDFGRYSRFDIAGQRVTISVTWYPLKRYRGPLPPGDD